MFAKLRNLFNKDGKGDDREFQGRVCAVFSDLFPDIIAVASDDPFMIDVGEIKIGLSNVRSRFNMSSRSDDDLRIIVGEHVRLLLETQKHIDAESPSWAATGPVLMPQLVNAERFGGMPILSIPFCGEVRIAFVLDSENAMRYVSDDMFESWEVNIKQVLDLAITNLEVRSNDISATTVPGNLFAVRSMDSFDAVRILSPMIRQAIIEAVGCPFYFGVPNRDFLVCWPKNAEMTEIWRTQVKVDSEEQPYPISKNIFESDEHGQIAEATDVKRSSGIES